MTDDQIAEGVEIAIRALFFCMLTKADTKSGDARRAIRVLFGDEVDQALSRHFAERQK